MARSIGIRLLYLDATRQSARRRADDAVIDGAEPATQTLRRLIIAGAALGLAAALMSRCAGESEFCPLAVDDGLAADGVKAGPKHQAARTEYRERLEKASSAAPGTLSGDVDLIREKVGGARNPARVSSPQVDDAYAAVDEWVAANC
ncbi:hypothetical protein MU582_07130 [Nocardioidaceae bacterium SCSIO 66511]|nr:hypothetical protein MU582_07130 [Nocardioidaceae bacterium SCSIO 66511]